MAIAASSARGTDTRAAGTNREAARRTPAALALLGALLAAALGWLASDLFPPRPMEAELALLLRGMAAIKTLLVVGLVAAIAWRSRWPMSPTLIAGYLAGAWSMAFATAMIWQLSAIAAAAVFFHVAEFAVLLMAWRDGLDRLLPPGKSRGH